jgi:hypothetical protein
VRAVISIVVAIVVRAVRRSALVMRVPTVVGTVVVVRREGCWRDPKIGLSPTLRGSDDRLRRLAGRRTGLGRASHRRLAKCHDVGAALSVDAALLVADLAASPDQPAHEVATVRLLLPEGRRSTHGQSREEQTSQDTWVGT